MASEGLNKGERKHLYISLLRGIANEAQDRLCASDRQHAWGPWARYQIQHDGPPAFHEGPIPDTVVHTRSERKCLNCGKEQNA